MRWGMMPIPTCIMNWCICLAHCSLRSVQQNGVLFWSMRWRLWRYYFCCMALPDTLLRIQKTTFGVPAVRVLGGLPGFKYISACLYACHGISTRTLLVHLKLYQAMRDGMEKAVRRDIAGLLVLYPLGYIAHYTTGVWAVVLGIATLVWLKKKFNRAGAEKEYEALSHLRYSGGRNRYSA